MTVGKLVLIFFYRIPVWLLVWIYLFLFFFPQTSMNHHERNSQSYLPVERKVRP